jgi:hypothetical protein
MSSRCTADTTEERVADAEIAIAIGLTEAARLLLDQDVVARACGVPKLRSACKSAHS